jgi:hypothetical protein
MENLQVVDNELVTLRTKNQQLIEGLISINKQIESQPLLARVSDWCDYNWSSGKITGVLKYLIAIIMMSFIVITSAMYSIYYFDNEIIRESIRVLYIIVYTYIVYNIRFKKKHKLL